MYYDKKLLMFKLTEATELGVEQFDALLDTADATEKIQLMLDLSTFGCNKPIVADMLRVIDVGNKVDWDSIDTNSERRMNIMFPPGCVCRVLLQHDKHDCGIDDAVVAMGCQPYGDNGKVFQRFLRPDYTSSRMMYLYSVMRPAYKPSVSALASVCAGLPDSVDSPGLIKLLEMLGVGYGS